jgi:Flp pilus assembly protein TadB
MSAGPTDEDGDQNTAGEDGDRSDTEASGDAAVADLLEQLDALREDLEAFEDDVEDRTVHRSEVESELRRYVRARLRRGHARGWGPYLVLLYGTAMTIGAFYLLTGGWAILAMIVVWLSTLGLYVLMLIVGAVLAAVSLPGRLAERFRD